MDHVLIQPLLVLTYIFDLLQAFGNIKGKGFVTSPSTYNCLLMYICLVLFSHFVFCFSLLFGAGIGKHVFEMITGEMGYE